MSTASHIHYPADSDEGSTCTVLFLCIIFVISQYGTAVNIRILVVNSKQINQILVGLKKTYKMVSVICCTFDINNISLTQIRPTGQLFTH